MSPATRDRLVRLAMRHGPWLFVTAVALWLLWPAPLGRMPLSADHTVHLTRIWMWSESLASGHARGWSSTWFLGTPIGELYPVLGDMIVIAVRVVSLGLLDWHQSYAIGLTLAFVIPAWAMLAAGRTLGMGALPGVVAAVLLLVDAGAYREGGWIYTITFGVWPQHLSTGLTWWGLSELAVACTSRDDARVRRKLGTAALGLGASLLAHPMAMLGIGIGGPLLVLVVGPRPWSNLRRAVPVALLGGVLGLAVAAWWLVPMLQHRAWMASYGWMWQPLRWMAAEASEGRWAQAMPTAVGTTISIGLLALAIAGGRRGRFFGAYALILWLLAARDVLWWLRLDQLSEGFTHLQYQRFITAAKPGLWLAAGFVVGGLAHLGRRAWTARWPTAAAARPLAAFLGVGAIGFAAWMTVDTRTTMREHEVGKLQLTRLPEAGALDHDYPEVTAWLAERWAERGDEEWWRVTFDAPRNLHWFMDAPVLSGVPVYKDGFTPGDNFVHKPETGHPAVLDAARVRYVITPRHRAGRGEVAAEFGELRVLERTTRRPRAWLDGPGELEILEDGIDGAPVRVRVSGTEGPTRLVFALSGYPRWDVRHDGTTLVPYEVPIRGDGPVATDADRRSGELRGGKAEGDDGTEPTLLAVDVTDGEVTLSYAPRRATDVLAGLVSWVALGLAIVLIGPWGRWPGVTARVTTVLRRLRPLGHPAVPLVVLVLVAGVAWRKYARAGAAEDARAVGRVEHGPARVVGARAGMLKAGMLIRPAVLVQRRRDRPAQIDLPGVTLGETLEGWIALDDDATKLRPRGKHRYRVLARTPEGEVVLQADRAVLHRAGVVPIAIDTRGWAGRTVDLRIVVLSDGEAPPPLGFDLELEPHAGEEAAP